MPQRFEYDRMTAEDFRAALEGLDLPAKGFARIWGVRAGTVGKWVKGEQDIPPWVYVAFALMRQDGAMVTARDAAANMIRRDNLRPQLGEYPYAAGGDFMEGEQDET
ncbi:hypothetical protein [Mesorhizobium sp. ANAO-SY3R2]|uniref:hypothetical protein n=1 Tax=Mesorhizobium sp. ANAO-SY3R2 TaxID=3166644 RepID=UPI003671ACE7